MLTQGRLKELLHYSPETGLFVWLIRRSGNVPAGRVAGGLNQDGYWMIEIDGRGYGAHRLAFLYMLGRWPAGVADHENRRRSDNRWGNLRDATHGQNVANSGLRKNNTLGYRGIRRHGKKFAAYASVDGKQKYLGLFDTAVQAGTVVQQERVRLHGDFAR